MLSAPHKEQGWHTSLSTLTHLSARTIQHAVTLEERRDKVTHLDILTNKSQSVNAKLNMPQELFDFKYNRY